MVSLHIVKDLMDVLKVVDLSIFGCTKFHEKFFIVEDNAKEALLKDAYLF